MCRLADCTKQTDSISGWPQTSTHTMGVFMVAVFFSLLCNCLGVNPGFRTTITGKGLDYIRQVGIPILEKSLSSVSIPDISGSAGTPIGSIDYTLSNIKLSSLEIPTSSLTSGGKGLVVKASGISLHVSADWHYREHSWPHISDSGSCDVSVSSVSLTVSVEVGVDPKGHPTLSSTGCSIDIGSLDITFHGGASWLYNLFSGYISDQLKSSLQGQLCKEATQEINTAGNKALESLPVEIQLDKISEIDYALLEAPNFTSTYIETNHKGEFFSIVDPVEAPFTPPPLPPVNDTSRMMYVWLTDYIANTAGFVYQSAGFLQYNVTPNTVPSGFPFQLNTSYFKPFVPQLYTKYPNMAMMLALKATKPPVLDVVPRTASFSAPGQMGVYVLDSNKEATLAFTLGMVLYANVTGKVQLNGTKEVISGAATFLKVDLSLVQTNIGQFSVDVLQATANLLCTGFIIPLLNRYGSTGLPLPVVDGVSLINSTLTLAQGYAVVSTDFSYKPSFLEQLIKN